MSKEIKTISKDYEVKLERVNKKLNRFMKIEGLKLQELTKEDVVKFVLEYFKTINRSSYYNNVRILNDILKNNNINIFINSKDYVDECVKIKDEQYFTKREIQDICMATVNYQDKFILYALFNGICGEKYEELLNIKIQDIAEDNSYIDLPTRRFMCDDYMKNIIRGCKKQTAYNKYIKSADLRAGDSYELNMESPYLIKVMPTARNNYGATAMSIGALHRKFMKIERELEERTGEPIILSGTSLIASGILFEMFLQEIENNKSWNVEEIDNFLKMNGIKKNPNEVYRAYHNRYHGSNRNIY